MALRLATEETAFVEHVAKGPPRPRRGAKAAHLAERRRGRRRLLFRVWSWEIASLAAALGLVAGIVALLAAYNEQQLPQWPYRINLNTLVSLLTLGLRTALVVVAAAVIGQSKWAWFHGRARRLDDFQIFDEASRGLLGSLKLMSLLRLGLRENPLAAAAAVTTIASLAISPFTQQAIKTVSCSRPTAHVGARVPVALEVPGADNYYRIGNSANVFQLGPRIQGAMVSGLTSPLGNESTILPVCPTGNCTFPEASGVSHSTIGLCAQCMETTPLLRLSWVIQTTGIVVPFNLTNASLGDLSVDLKFASRWLATGTTNLSYAESSMSPEFKYAARQACGNVSIISVTGKPSEFCRTWQLRYCVVAVSCTLYPCMKDFKVGVVNGRLEEHVVKTVPARVKPLSPGQVQVWGRSAPDYHVVKSPCVIDDKLYHSSNFSLVPADPSRRTFSKGLVEGREMDVPSDCRYSMSADYSFAIGTFMNRRLFRGQCQDPFGGNDDLLSVLDCNHTWWLHQFYNNGQASFEALNASIQNMATATTNFFRQDGWGPVHNLTVYRKANDSAMFKSFLRGEVLENTVCMRLEWPWLLLPLLLCLATMVLLASMLLINASNLGQPVWKSSTLPLLFFGLDARQAEGTLDGAYATDLASLDKQAKALAATLDLAGPRPGLEAVEAMAAVSSDETLAQPPAAMPLVSRRSSGRGEDAGRVSRDIGSRHGHTPEAAEGGNHGA